MISGGTRRREALVQGSAAEPIEPRFHSHITDRLAKDHPLATRRVSCERCEAILHVQSNSCIRTWVESGRGNYCLYCFLVVAGGLAPDHAGRLVGVDRLPASFALKSAQ
jgi:hypothetical protein